MDVAGFMRHLTTQPDYQGQVTHIEPIAARAAIYGKLDKPLPTELQECLDSHGLKRLYSHQADALNKLRQGKNVIVATWSASGKTLCYNVAVAEALLTRRSARALYLFPTKALAQDQLRTLRELLSPELFDANDFATFDGDTPRQERAEIRKQARVILTNPDMLHIGILPNHAFWSGVLRHLSHVVVDEAHIYRGVFGSHVADVLRRLRRLGEVYGSRPQFILASATIANPGEHAQRLTGLPFEVVDSDSSPRGAKQFVLWNPPLIDKAKSARRSSSTETTSIFTELVSAGVRTLAFARTRRLTELIYIYSRKRLAEIASNLAKTIQPYRAGYLPEERRRIERELFGGHLLGVIATNALELGIDSGGLEATVLSGYPGSIASTWQQAGRSGRKREESLSFLVALDGPLDQYLMRHPEAFFRKGVEHALVNPANPYILRSHLLCAAWERPLGQSDEALFGPEFRRELRFLEAQGAVRERTGRWYLSTTISCPAQSVNIRSSSGENYEVIDSATGSLIETVEASVAFQQVHPGAIYLHQGDAYLVKRLDLASRTALVAPTEVNYYTQAKELTDLRIIDVRQTKKVGGVNVRVGGVEVTTTVVGFKKKAQFTERVIAEEPLSLPPRTFPTVALWFDLPVDASNKVVELRLDYPGGLHATEHAAIGILPMFALCDRNDIGGVSTALHADTGQAEIFIYDAYPGGIGIAEKGFEMIAELWQATLKVIAECPCEEGCPSCIQSPKCGNNNRPLDKQAARILLEGLLKNISTKPS